MSNIIDIKLPKPYKFKIEKIEYSYLPCGCCCTSCCVYGGCSVNGVRSKAEKIKVGLYIADSNIGFVNLIPKGKELATHSWLSSNYRNKGLGVLMYARAIQYALENKKRIRSSGESSGDAQRVWKSKTLRKFFRIRRYDDSNYPKVDTYATWRAYQKR